MSTLILFALFTLLHNVIISLQSKKAGLRLQRAHCVVFCSSDKRLQLINFENLADLDV
jgi:hypothetical protein